MEGRGDGGLDVRMGARDVCEREDEEEEVIEVYISAPPFLLVVRTPTRALDQLVAPRSGTTWRTYAG